MPHQPSPSFGYRGRLPADFETLMQAATSGNTRKKLRKKERNLSRYGELRYWRAGTSEEVRRVLDAFFAQKATRMRELGMSDVFAEPGVRDFVAAASMTGLPAGRPAIELYACSIASTIVATYGGVVREGRFCAMFNSIIRNEFAAESPGELLLFQLVRMCCERGLTTFDLGVGEAGYKDTFCSEPEPLFDAFVPLTPLGQTAAATLSAVATIKRQVKRSRFLWAAVQTARRQLYAARRN